MEGAPLAIGTASDFAPLVVSQRPKIPLNHLAVIVIAQSILETIVDIFDPLVGMGNAVSSAELGEKPRGASFVDKLFIPFSGKLKAFNASKK